MALEPRNMTFCMFWKEALLRYREHEISPASNSSTVSDIHWPDTDTENGLPWTTICNKFNCWKKWLDSDEARRLPTLNNTSSSFLKGALPPINENDPEFIRPPASFHSFEDDTLDGAEYESEVFISTSISSLDI
ncbi:hypothetical protein BATDEDRAFT_23218 [Batrachochytrium dendrobatidis JAM81]|uniref:Uncharacterized protein n=1 Tax=Batrachochytrium dendrobatidis (strain JAM81 / FGSC 10211) TaxID=684364 RepID=F4NYC2_BATDJ|nr:uncharacterized protein BATDEDRAFT_23218 [Batrachochytrium dendrobatidis JAM81]EGF81690.1 hypothetical protein BATDEDRAFT_23218 [Batrachochytrium dendrobatidis JAM81]|eukprot:XP_006677223.1 hypothetical protein BATDEDRAFT_23218 [Batrachochytrium dendrobatidis JAM81]